MRKPTLLKEREASDSGACAAAPVAGALRARLLSASTVRTLAIIIQLSCSAPTMQRRPREKGSNHASNPPLCPVGPGAAPAAA